ncbi:MAG TPA: redoxin family protein [Chryseosolibacter sp.]|nr:redoxin family protein [Chryseosolibacter sp.]
MTYLRIFLWAALLIITVTIPLRGQALVELTIRPYNNGKIFVTQPLQDGRHCHSNWRETTANKNGKLVLKFPLTAPGFVTVTYGSRVHDLYVEPGAKVKATIAESIVFNGDLIKQNEFLASRGRPDRYPHGMSEKSVPPLVARLKHMSNQEFIDTITTCLNRELEKLESLGASDPTALTGHFREMAANDAHYYYRILGVSALEQRYMKYLWPGHNAPLEIPNPEFIQSTAELWAFLFPEELLKRRANYSKNHGLYLLNYILRYKGAFLKELASHEPDRINFFIDDLALAQKYLEGEVLETFLAYYFLYYFNPAHFSRELLDYHKTLKERFPDSPYLAITTPKAMEIEQSLGPGAGVGQTADVKVIQNFKAIDDYPTLLEQFKGKVVFVDIWASWCGPCIQEFPHYGPIHKLQKDRSDFVVLYVSRDRPEHAKRWERFIHERKLSGYHLIPNEKLVEDLRKRIGWEAIPRYVLTNKRGELVNTDAPSPRHAAKLLNQIEKILKE